MKLTGVLLRFAKRLPRGHLWHGKDRLYKRIKPGMVQKKLQELKLQEENMFYLRHPYLTPEQSHGHAKPFKHHEKFIEAKKEANLKWRNNVLLGDRFGFLKITEKWE